MTALELADRLESDGERVARFATVASGIDPVRIAAAADCFAVAAALRARAALKPTDASAARG
jgi:hypothetical protein